MQISVKLGGADVFTLGVYLFNTDIGVMDGFAAIEWDLGGFVEGDVVDLGGVLTGIDTSMVDDVMVQLAEADYVHTLQITTAGGVWEQDLELYDGETIRSYTYDADIPADVDEDEDEDENGDEDNGNGINLGGIMNIMITGMIVVMMMGMMSSTLKED